LAPYCLDYIKTRLLTLQLSPYTTLFRSTGKGRSASGPDQRSDSCSRLELSSVRAATPGASRDQPPVRAELTVPTPADAACTCAADRKSTRLNSSHVKISYAVFCLKKKSS